MDYRDWGDGEERAPARRAADPPERVRDNPPVDPPAGGGGPRVPGQRGYGYDEELSRPYVPAADPGWNEPPPGSGRHRRSDQGEAGPEPPARGPDTWHAENRWRPTLDPTDWRYATDDVGYPYGPAAWEDERDAHDRHRGPRQNPDRYDTGGRYGAERDTPDSRPQADDATEVFGPIRDDQDPTTRHDTERGQWPLSVEPDQWRRTTDSEQGRRSTGREPWSPEVTGHWELPSDTGQWERFGDTGEWLGGQPTGPEPTGPEPTGPEPIGPAGPPDAQYGQDTFWSGIRLSGDDPRWTRTPSSAPHSPAVSLADDPTSPTLPRAAAPPSGSGPEPDHDESGESGGVLAVMLFTVAWYVVPALVLLAWILTLDGSPPQDCATDAAQRCLSARAQAASAVIDGGPRAAAALGASLGIAVLLRWASGWRAASVGLAAAVIGGGLTTLLVSVISGQPLG